MSLPQKLPLDLLQTKWAQELDPVLKFPPVKGVLLKSIALTTGTNVVNHRLSRNLQGWVITRIKSAATIYDQQDSNQTPALTLILVSSADAVIDLWVY
jgi:hypothetical protein